MNYQSRAKVPHMSPALQKRIEGLWALPEDLQLYAYAQTMTTARLVQMAKERGTGKSVSPSLDIKSITAPELVSETACRNPAWIQLRCVHGNTLWKRIRCRRCEGCVNAWRARVRGIIREGCSLHRVWFWTLTIKEYGGKELFDIIQERWHNLLRLCDKKGLKFEYFRVVELQQRGTPHYHLAVKSVRKDGHQLEDTTKIYRLLRRLQKKVGFGYRAGKTTHFEAARLGGNGVASYMSKYLKKGLNFSELVRADGRAVRRYCRSRGWSKSLYEPSLRYSRIADSYSREPQSEQELQCRCGEHMLINESNQIRLWLRACRDEGAWVAPMRLIDKIIKIKDGDKFGYSYSQALRSP